MEKLHEAVIGNLGNGVFMGTCYGMVEESIHILLRTLNSLSAFAPRTSFEAGTLLTPIQPFAEIMSEMRKGEQQ